MCHATSNSKTQLLTLAAFGITATGEATGIVDLGDSLSPIQVIGTQAIRDGSSVMVTRSGASLTAFSFNHGVGRRLSRTEAKSLLTRSEVNALLENAGIL